MHNELDKFTEKELLSESVYASLLFIDIVELPSRGVVSIYILTSRALSPHSLLNTGLSNFLIVANKTPGIVLVYILAMHVVTSLCVTLISHLGQTLHCSCALRAFETF